MKFTVAIVGRPNVGKSTLFNLLSIKTKAIVHDKPGVTRDRKYSDARLSDLEFQIIDTPGLEQLTKHFNLSSGMRNQTLQAIKEANAVMFVVDAMDGLMADDYEFAKLVRKLNDKIILISNKAERNIPHTPEYYKLGFGEPIRISAAHRLGMADLYTGLAAFAPSEQKIEEVEGEKPISIAIVGKPNVGKSSFVNAILQEERLLTFDEAGTTRESIDVMWEYKGKKLKLIDTAGIRRRKNINLSLEQLSAGDAIHSIKFANTVILMLDATDKLSKQDLVIANLVIEHGRCLVIAFNKIDLITNIKAFKEEVTYQIEKSLGQIKNVSITYFSARKLIGLNSVIDSVLAAHDIWNKKISTGQLNKWLNIATTKHSLTDGRVKIRVKYCVQTSIRPPSFQFFANKPDKILDSYKLYLLNSLRHAFKMDGVPIRMQFSATNNPYSTRK
jgi:GTP-binding protein